MHQTQFAEEPGERGEQALLAACIAAAGFSVDAASRELEGGTDPAYGSVRWRTLLCADRTPSSGFVLGIAELDPGGWLPTHRHAQAEFYLGLSGSGTVTIEGRDHPIGPGVAVYLPCDAEHAVLAGEAGLAFAYGFATDRFADVTYRFTAASG